MRSRLQRGDSLLIGADLVKPAAKLRLAYDDPIGVTAAFNLNVLARINRELGGEFGSSSSATWCAGTRRSGASRCTSNRCDGSRYASKRAT